MASRDARQTRYASSRLTVTKRKTLKMLGYAAFRCGGLRCGALRALRLPQVIEIARLSGFRYVRAARHPYRGRAAQRALPFERYRSRPAAAELPLDYRCQPQSENDLGPSHMQPRRRLPHYGNGATRRDIDQGGSGYWEKFCCDGHGVPRFQ